MVGATMNSMALLIILSLFLLVNVSNSVPALVITDVQKHRTGSHVFSTATCVVSSASAFHRGLMTTRKSVLATTTGKQRKENPSALE
ncbi:hypothetical protein QQ045_029728 [Rhodiola kirilowii]